MQSDQPPTPYQHGPEPAPINLIRVETALSRYPIHRLAKQGCVAIEIREESPDGGVLIRWEVSHNSRFGQPGPLAYKLDTLIINRKIEEASRPIPRILCLGSLTEIAEQLGLGGDTNKVKTALRQNASAFISAKLRYRAGDGAERTIEADFTRYAVVFMGETLSDGRRADAVYLELSDRFLQVLNGAQTRPLDYDYLKELSPASQRFYELVSYQIFAALKHNRPRARYAYSEFCAYAPQARYLDFDRVKKQMYKVHAPHRKSGYIEGVEFEPRTDAAGRPDWMMHYTPGPKAQAEYRTFTKRGGPKVLALESRPCAPGPQPQPQPEPGPEPTPLEQEIIRRGVTPSTAAELVRTYPEDRITAQVEYADWIREKDPKKIRDLGPWLSEAIRKDFAAPAGFVSRAERARREEARRQERQGEVEARGRKLAQEARERDARTRIDAYLERLLPEDLEKLDREALEQADQETRDGYQRQHPSFKGLYLRHVREAYVRALLNLPPAPDA